MKVLVTGGSGYIGGFIVEHLLERGAEVAVISRLNKWRGEPEHFPVSHVFQGDLLDKTFVGSVLKNFSPQAIVHAAWAGTGRKDRNSVDQADNLIAMGNLLNAAVESGIDRFIGLGTQAEYGVHNTRISEDLWPLPKDNYGVFKLAAGLAGRQFARSHTFRYAWLRLFSSFGPRDHSDFFVPYVIESLLTGEAPRLTSCEQMWDYLYVKDVARLVCKVVDSDETFCDVFNLCSGVPTRLRDVVTLVRELSASATTPVLGAVPLARDGLVHLEGDNTRFKDTFGWLQLTDLRMALMETVEWFRTKLAATRNSSDRNQ
jgi:UDP-glucose 4-epimerase